MKSRCCEAHQSSDNCTYACLVLNKRVFNPVRRLVCEGSLFPVFVGSNLARV